MTVSLYELLLFVHVLAAIAWVGGALAVLLLMELAQRAGDRAYLVRLLHYDDRLAPIMYIPAAVLVLLAGVALVFEGPWSFGDGWVLAGLGLLTGAFVVGLGFLVPGGRRISEAAGRHGPESDEAAAEVLRLRPLAWLDLGLLVAAVFVMTTKPF